MACRSPYKSYLHLISAALYMVQLFYLRNLIVCLFGSFMCYFVGTRHHGVHALVYDDFVETMPLRG